MHASIMGTLKSTINFWEIPESVLGKILSIFDSGILTVLVIPSVMLLTHLVSHSNTFQPLSLLSLSDVGSFLYNSMIRKGSDCTRI